MLPLLLRIEHAASGQVAEAVFERSPVRLGRGEGVELILPDPALSLVHGAIHFDEAGERYEDYRSTNGSRLGDAVCRPRRPMAWEAGVVLCVGTLRLTHERAHPPPGFAASEVPAASFGERPSRDQATRAIALPRAGTVARGAVRPAAGMPLGAAVAAPAVTAAPAVATPAATPAPRPFSRALPSTPGETPRGAAPPATVRPATPMPAPPAPRVPSVPPPARATPATPRVATPSAAAAAPTVVVATPEVPVAGAAEAVALDGAARAAIRTLVESLAPPYQSWRAAWAALYRAMDGAFAGVPQAAWRPALTTLAQALPELASEREFQRAAAEQDVDLNLDALVAPRALAAVRTFAVRLGLPPPRTGADVEDLLVRAAEGLDVFARMFVAARDGAAATQRETLGDVRPVVENPALDRAQNADEVFAVLFATDVAPVVGAEELRRAQTDLLVHSVAIVDALCAGAREIVDGLHPDRVGGAAGNGAIERTAPRRWYDWMPWARDARRWGEYVAAFDALVGEQRPFFEALFGGAFRKAYQRAAQQAERKPPRTR